MFSGDDLQQLKENEISLDIVEKQIEDFKKGYPFSNILRAAIPDAGISVLDQNEISDKVSVYEDALPVKDIVKFVPASGAASRMFKKLFEFLDSDVPEEKIFEDQSDGSVFTFFKNIENFSFYSELAEVYEKNHGVSLPEALLRRDYKSVLKCLLLDEGLAYGQMPKGLLLFHGRGSDLRTPLEEHIVEGVKYAATDQGVKIHFTVSPEHLNKFKAKANDILPKYVDQSIQLSYSIQKLSTDTIAVTLENEPFREKDGRILFRPAGHGALLENLNDIDADIIFLKNIDNVVPDHLKPETIKFKKVIGGVLVDLQDKIFKHLSSLEDKTNFDEQELKHFFIAHLGMNISGDLTCDQAIAILNRPIRVCGMVKNQGEAGGGPFWVKSEGNESLQVVESAQVDLTNEDQKKIFQESTHFNPVDVVCGVKNYLGKKFNLLEYRDPSAGFITEKSKDGKNLKAQELPGLWNGGMAYWNTVFVEIPLITFNPVKSVNDLLRPEHQPK